MKPRILFLDIETSPLTVYSWGLHDQNISLQQVKSDWFILSWAAKWSDESEVMYQDLRGKRKPDNDKDLLQSIWKLLDEADIICTQNGRSFDSKKLNARFIQQGFKPPSSYKHIDTLVIAKKYFGFTSNKLAYMTDKLCTKYKKLEHKKFPGLELWQECLKGNIKAWREMEKYNKHDVLSLEELYHKLIAWDVGTDFNVYHDKSETTCKCESKEFNRNGYFYSSMGKYQRYRCKQCGAEARSKINEFDKSKKESLRKGPQ